MCSYTYVSFSSFFCLYLTLMPVIQFHFDSDKVYSSCASFISRGSPFPNDADSFSTEHINFLSYIFKCCISIFLSGPEKISGNIMIHLGLLLPNWTFTFELQHLFYLFLCDWHNKYKHKQLPYISVPVRIA